MRPETALQPPGSEPAALPGVGVDEPHDRDGTKRYYLLRWDAPDAEPVPTRASSSAACAAEAFLDARLKASLPIPPWRGWLPPGDDVPDFCVAWDSDDRRYVIGPAHWPDGRPHHHGSLRNSFNGADRRELVEGLKYLLETGPTVAGWPNGLHCGADAGSWDGPTKRQDPGTVGAFRVWVASKFARQRYTHVECESDAGYWVCDTETGQVLRVVSGDEPIGSIDAAFATHLFYKGEAVAAGRVDRGRATIALVRIGHGWGATTWRVEPVPEGCEL